MSWYFHDTKLRGHFILQQIYPRELKEPPAESSDAEPASALIIFLVRFFYPLALAPAAIGGKINFTGLDLGPDVDHGLAFLCGRSGALREGLQSLKDLDESLLTVIRDLLAVVKQKGNCGTLAGGFPHEWKVLSRVR